MSQENVEIVRRIFDAWAAGDLSAGRGDLDEHVVFVVSSDFPAWGVHLGRDGVRGFMLEFLAQWERLTIKAKQIEAVGDTVLAEVVQRGKGKASGIEGDTRYFMLFTFRGGAIVRWEILMNESEALDAVGLSEQDAHADP
jgi:ketosteroid isomerase-like protein